MPSAWTATTRWPWPMPSSASARSCAAGRGPVLLDTITYRFSGHSPSDASAYRTKEEVDLWRSHDAIIGYREYLLENGHATESELDSLVQGTIEQLKGVLTAAISPELSPRMAIEGEEIGEVMFSQPAGERMADRQPEVLLPLEETRWKQTQEKFRFGLDAQGKPHAQAQDI